MKLSYWCAPVGLLTCSVAIAGLKMQGGSLPRLRVSGDQILAGSRPIRLRGINWGWWQLEGTIYREREMRRMAEWGANVARLPFDAAWLEREGRPGVWNEEGFRRIDEVLSWARRWHVYVILDMHIAPGGQNPTPYTVGGANALWTDPDAQTRFAQLWREIARRYRTRPEVAAYELMNEPETKGLAPRGTLRNIFLRGLRAIRSVDRQTIVVVGGDAFSGVTNLTNEIVMPDRNVLYTFHFYDPGRLTWQYPVPGCSYPALCLTEEKWLRNTAEGPGIAGSADWQLMEHRFTAPEDAIEAAILLRSTANTGTAWFDDLTIEEANGTPLLQADFANGPQGFFPERPPESSMTWDPEVGRTSAGSLRVRATPEHTGWISPRIRLKPGQEYRVIAWVRLQDATGDTYLSAAFYGGKLERVDRSWLRRRIEPALKFAARHRVPVWVGEFGCGACAPPGSQIRWVRDCISVFEEAGFHWTYWSFRETTGPHSLALEPHSRSGEEWLNLPLLAELRKGWSGNYLKPPRARR